MTIRELINALTEIERQHGPDVPVCHYDDWEYFLVTRVSFVPEFHEAPDYVVPKYVAIDGSDTLWPSRLPGGSEYEEESK
jgi:hypothetical protein